VDAILFSNKWLRFDFQGSEFFCSCAAFAFSNCVAAQSSTPIV
jgi:hypothetical protein